MLTLMKVVYFSTIPTQWNIVLVLSDLMIDYRWSDISRLLLIAEWVTSSHNLAIWYVMLYFDIVVYILFWNVSRQVYRQVSNIRRTLIGNKIVDHSDVVGALPVGAAPTTSSFST